MATLSAVRYQVVATPRRRIVTASPAARPGLQPPQAHPARTAAPGRIVRAASCRVSRPEPRSPWLAVKVTVVAALAVLGGAVSVGELVGGVVSPDPVFGYVAGDPAWAHVTQP